MRVVLDTNIVVAGLLWHGPPSRLIAEGRSGVLDLATSPELLSELDDVLSRNKFAAQFAKRGFDQVALINSYLEIATVFELTVMPKVVSDDPDDDRVIATALVSGAKAIVSGDNHVLSLGAYKGIAVMRAAELLSALEGS